MKYICKRCGYSTNIKCNLINHLYRKKQCEVININISRETLLRQLAPKCSKMAPKCSKMLQNGSKRPKSYEFNNIYQKTNPLECSFCNKIYSKMSNLKRHLEKCKVKEEEECLKKEETDLIKEIMAQKDKEMSSMRKQIELLMTTMGNTNIENNNCNNTTNNLNTNITNIQINGWGQEDRSHLTDKFYRFCYDRPFTSIPRVIEAVFFNPNYPKNWNVMIKDDKTSKALIYDKVKDAWLKKEKDGVVETLIHTGYSMLDENFDKQKNANKLTDKRIEKFTKFQDFYTKGDKEYEKRLTTEIKELLINYKAYHILPNVL